MSDFKYLDNILKDFVKKDPAGCGCAIAKEGKILYEGYHGLADIETERPITEDTVFRLWSMTKVIACTAALMLFERGKFLLNDPLGEYLPDYKEHTIASVMPDGSVKYTKSKSPMLVKHAFTMAVGMPYPSEDSPTAAAMTAVREELDKKHGLGRYTLADEIKAMAEVPIAFEPGTRYMYGYGHDLVAGLIEAVSGKKVGRFLQDEIFDPLGMSSTGYRYFGDIRERMASIYQRGKSGEKEKTEAAFDYLHEPEALLEFGGVGLFSTVRDYLKFSQMMANGGRYNGEQIIGRKTIDLMRQNQLGEKQMSDYLGTCTYNAGYGYGLGVRTMMNPAAGGSNTSVGEFGWTGFLGTWTSIDPSEGVSAVYMHQMMPNMEEYHHLRVRAAVYGSI